MGALTPMVLKGGFLTTPFTESPGYPSTHTFKELRLSCSVHCLCTGTHIFREREKNHFLVECVTVYMHGHFSLLEHIVYANFSKEEIKCLCVCDCIRTHEGGPSISM